MITQWDSGGVSGRRRAGSLVGAALALAILLPAPGAVGSVAAATGPSGRALPAPITRTNEGGAVTIAVSWQGPQAGLVFTVAMETHAVDLDRYDLRTLAVLRTNQGYGVRPRRWNAPPGGHHREGILAFPSRSPKGRPMLGPGTRAITLVLRNVAGVPERRFTWALAAFQQHG